MRVLPPSYAFGSVLSVNVAALAAWHAWGSPGWHGLLLIQVFALALLAAAAAAVAFCLWDSTARFSVAALYLLSFAAVAFALICREFSPREYLWTSAPELAGTMLGAGVVGWLYGRLRSHRLESAWPAMVARLSEAASRPNDWFQRCQAVLAAIVATLAVWVSFDVNNDGLGVDTALFGLAGRWAGPPTALMLLGAAITMAWQSAGRCRRRWQKTAFGAGFLVNLTIGLAALDVAPGTPGGEAPWLNRCAILLTSAAMLTLLSRFGLKGALPRAGDWLDTGRQVAPLFAALTAITLPILLLGEFLAFDPATGAPISTFSVVAVPVLLAPLAAGCLRVAIQPDSAGIAPETAGRFAHGRLRLPVPALCGGAAAAIVTMGALHLWLCRPQWFSLFEHLGVFPGTILLAVGLVQMSLGAASE